MLKIFIKISFKLIWITEFLLIFKIRSVIRPQVCLYANYYKQTSFYSVNNIFINTNLSIY